MVDNVILVLGIMVIGGYFAGYLVNRVGLPRISGYIIIGIVLSPSLSGVIAVEAVDSLDPLNTIALGIIAFAIGSELFLKRLKQQAATVSWILPAQVFATFLLVSGGILLFAPVILDPSDGFLTVFLPMAIVLGSIATATAPAAVLATIDEYRAKGPLTTTLLSIVAVDDAVAIIVFSLALGVGGALSGATGGFSPYDMLGKPLLYVVESGALGAAMGFAMVYAARLVGDKKFLLAILLGAILLCAGIAEYLEISIILAPMVMGFIVTNRAGNDDMLKLLETLKDLIFMLFFVLAGLHFNLDALQTAGLLALVIFFSRAIGKYGGTWVGGRLSRAPEKISNYLGIALIPAAGVSIGLAAIARQALPEAGDIIYTAVIASVVLSELAGPPLSKLALHQSGERNKDRTK